MKTTPKIKNILPNQKNLSDAKQPNKQTAEAMQDADNRKTVKVKNINELFDLD